MVDLVGAEGVGRYSVSYSSHLSQIFSSSSLSFWLSPIGNLLMGVWEEETKWKTKLKKVADEVHNIPTMDNNLTTLLQQLAQLLNLQQQQCLT